MAAGSKPKYYLVEASVLPEIFAKVIEAKELLETGQVRTVADAVARVDISRSAFYKYRDAIEPFQNMMSGRIITFQFFVQDELGILSVILGVFAKNAANVLTINSLIPTNGSAAITISAETSDLSISLEDFLRELEQIPGVVRAEVLAG